jgi:hypothetical protein
MMIQLTVNKIIMAKLMIIKIIMPKPAKKKK